MTVTDTARNVGGEVRIALPWPERDLSPNARVHWRKLYDAKKAARGDAAWATKAVIRRPPDWTRAGLTFQFCPPNKRRRDLDNLIASMKAATDGIADALGIDDSKFISTYHMGEPVKGGAVLVTVRSA